MGAYSMQQIMVYPVKACRGVSVSCVAISRTGLLYDREWMVVSAEKGRLIAQVKAPKLASVEPSLPPGAFTGEILSSDANLEIRAPGMPVLEVPINQSAHQMKAGKGVLVDVYVYGWEGKGYDEGPEAASWWSSYLGYPAHLVRFNPGLVNRQVLFAPDGYQTGFSNTGQFLVASQASLDDLNRRLPNAIPMNRFRPNFIIAGPAAFDEDKWEKFSIVHSGRESIFTFVHPCARCKVPTINQENPESTGEEPLKTLATYRTGDLLKVKIGNGKQVFFGTYFVCEDTLYSMDAVSSKPAFVAVNDLLCVYAFNSEKMS